MHELAIADSIVELATVHAGGRRVRSVRVTAGALHQIVPGALAFAFGLLAEGTELEDAALELRTVPAQARCRDCGAETPQHCLPLACRACAGADVEVTAGDELLVEELVVEEEPELRRELEVSHAG